MKFLDGHIPWFIYTVTDQSTVRIAEYQRIFEKPSSDRLLGMPKEQERQARNTEPSHNTYAKSDNLIMTDCDSLINMR